MKRVGHYWMALSTEREESSSWLTPRHVDQMLTLP
jgi:hypothetical protein